MIQVQNVEEKDIVRISYCCSLISFSQYMLKGQLPPCDFDAELPPNTRDGFRINRDRFFKPVCVEGGPTAPH